MKRLSKFFLVAGGIFGSVCIGFVFQKMGRLSSNLLGGEMILDNPSWRKRDIPNPFDPGYKWVTPKTILFRKNVAGYSRVMRQPVERGKSLPPEAIPNVILNGQEIVISLSPDEQTLCLAVKSQRRKWKFLLIPTDNKNSKKRVVIDSWSHQLLWMPDSNALLIRGFNQGYILQHYDTESGILTETKFKAILSPQLINVTPDGRVICMDYQLSFSLSNPKPPLTWTISEIQGDKVSILAQYNTSIFAQSKVQSPAILTELSLAPTGDRLLWKISEQNEGLFMTLQRKIFQKKVPLQRVTRWEVSDLNGKNRRVLGFNTQESNHGYSYEMRPDWTPDGKGVHYIKNKQLFYLDVPK